MQCEVLIVGGGIAGLSSAYYLARAGVDVLLVEAADALGSHSTGQNAAILRSLLPDPALTAIGRNSAQLLHTPPPGFPKDLVDSSGLLLTADLADAADLETWVTAAGRAPHATCQAEPVNARRAAALAPHISHPDWPAFGPDQTAALWLPSEGQINIAALVEGFTKGALHPGPKGKPARIKLDARLTRLDQEPHTEASAEAPAITGAHLADGTHIRTRRVLFTGGAWAGQLAQLAGSPLEFEARRRHLVVAASPGRDGSSPDPSQVPQNLPTVWNHSRSARCFYTRPELPGLLICACDETSLEPIAAPDQQSCPRDPAVLEEVARIAAEFIPAHADSAVTSWWAGWRTFSPRAHKQRFTIGPDPAVPGLFWSAALGGHGMTASFEVGRLSALAIATSLNHRHDGCLDGPSYGNCFAPKQSLSSKA